MDPANTGHTTTGGTVGGSVGGGGETPTMSFSSPIFEQFEIDDSGLSTNTVVTVASSTTSSTRPLIDGQPAGATPNSHRKGFHIPEERRPELNRVSGFTTPVKEEHGRKASTGGISGHTKVKLTLGKRTALCLLAGGAIALAMILIILWTSHRSHASDHSLIDANHALRTGHDGLKQQVSELRSALHQANETANDMMHRNNALALDLSLSRKTLLITNESLANATEQVAKLHATNKELAYEKTHLALGYAQANSSMLLLRLDNTNLTHQIDKLRGELGGKEAEIKRLQGEKSLSETKLHSELGEKKAQIQRLQNEKSASEKAQAKLTKENAALRGQIDDMKREQERKAAEALVVARGQIFTRVWGRTYCLEAYPSGGNNVPVQIHPCSPKNANQYWIMTKTGEVKQGPWCLDFHSDAGRGPVTWSCHGFHHNQEWTYDSKLKKCLEASYDGKRVEMHGCAPWIPHQQWTIGSPGG